MDQEVADALAALENKITAIEVQAQQRLIHKNALIANSRPPMEVISRDCPFFNNGFGYYGSRGGGGGIKNNCLAADCILDIDRRLSIICSFIENVNIPTKVEIK